jgi:hypothetical protein
MEPFCHEIAVNADKRGRNFLMSQERGYFGLWSRNVSSCRQVLSPGLIE